MDMQLEIAKITSPLSIYLHIRVHGRAGRGAADGAPQGGILVENIDTAIAGGVATSPHRKVIDAIAIQIADGQRGSEPTAFPGDDIIRVCGRTGRGAADGAPQGGILQKNIGLAGKGDVFPRANSQVALAIAVQVANGNRRAKIVFGGFPLNDVIGVGGGTCGRSA